MTTPLLEFSAVNVTRCAHALLSGELIGLPTETVYGLAADACNEQAIQRIYTTKGRPNDHPLIVHVSGASAAKFWFEESEYPLALKLMHAFWPGPLTLIVRLKTGLPSFACAGQPTVGLRSPSHPAAQFVLQEFEALGGRGVAAPSANKFGRVSPTSAEHVLQDLAQQCPLTLDGGESAFGIESTIVDLTVNPPRILRPGSITAYQIEKVLELSLQLSPADLHNKKAISQIDSQLKMAQSVEGITPPKVSGSLAAHYAPATPMRLVQANELSSALETARRANQSTGVIAMSEATQAVISDSMIKWLNLGIDPYRYARELYRALRHLDQLGLNSLIVVEPEDSPHWSAVRDRLGRSAFGSQQNNEH